MHVEDDVAPVAVEYVPATQDVQAVAEDAPVDEEYLPAPQFTQVVEAVAPTAVE
jgi:hypothetical protein